MATTPITTKALRVEGGRVVHVAGEGPEMADALSMGMVHGMASPDGTYLRLDYVVEALRGMVARVPESPARTALVVAAEHFERIAL